MGDLSRNFSRSEFACFCECGLSDPSLVLVEALQELRDIINQPIIVTAGLRCIEQNKRVGGRPNSQHLKGNAADISIRHMKIFDLLLAADTVDAFRNGGIGIYNHHIHVDVRGYEARWTLRT